MGYADIYGANGENHMDLIDDICGDIDDSETLSALVRIMDYADYLTETDCLTIIDAARVADPTFSGVGAEIRDALRDNTNYNIF
jgi:hypothetical protein